MSPPSVHNGEKSCGTCGRPLGQDPRNRQHCALSYYFGREQKCIPNLPTLGDSAVLVLPRNPYRTQVTFTALLTEGSSGVALAHSLADLNNVHRVIMLVPAGGNLSPLSGVAYSQTVILSYPVHGPMVGEEWWAASDGAIFDEIDATGYLWSD
jgi:hypothetical protein